MQTGGDAPVVHALGAATGRTLWTRTLSGRLRGAAYGDGKVIVSTDSTRLRAQSRDRVAGAGRRPQAVGAGMAPWSQAAWSTFRGQSAVTALRASDGGHVWTRAGLHFADGLAVDADRVYLNDVSAAVALRRTDGQVIWRYEPPMYTSFSFGSRLSATGACTCPGCPRERCSTRSPGALLRRPWIHAAPALDGARAYVLDGEPGEMGEVLHVRGAGNGATRWEFGAETGITTAPLVSGETVYAMGTRGVALRARPHDRTADLVRRTPTRSTTRAPRSASRRARTCWCSRSAARSSRWSRAARPGATTTGSRSPAITARAATASPTARGRGELARAAGLARGIRAQPGPVPGLGPLRGARARPHAARPAATGATLALGARDGLPGGDVRVRTAAARRRGPRGRCAGRPALPASSTTTAARTPRAGAPGSPCIAASACTICGPGSTWCSGAAARSRFEYDLVVAPGADVRAPRARLPRRRRGRSSTAAAGCVIGTRAGILRQPPPVAYQRVRRRRERVPRASACSPTGASGSRSARSTPTAPLVIDPELEWGSFLGGGVDDAATDVTTDAAGIRLCGRPDRTRATSPRSARSTAGTSATRSARTGPAATPSSPSTRRAATGSCTSPTSPAAARTAPRRSRPTPQGNAYVTGYTMSPNFPVANALQPIGAAAASTATRSWPSSRPTAVALEYGDLSRRLQHVPRRRRDVASPSTRRGARWWQATPIRSSSRRRAGAADSDVRRPPTAFCDDAFVAKLSADGARLVWSTLFGGDGSAEYAVRRGDRRAGAAGDRRHRVRHRHDRLPGDARRLRPGDRVQVQRGVRRAAARPTARGSTGRRRSAAATGTTGSAMALDAQGDVHIAGHDGVERLPDHGGSPRPGLQRVYEEFSCTNHADGFALELSADGARLLASTYVGGAGRGRRARDRAGRRRARLPDGRHGVAGGDASRSSTPFQPEQRGRGEFCASRSDCSDAYVMRLSANKAKVEYSSFLGGRSHEVGEGIALAGADAWVAGFTHSTDLATTPDGTQPSAPGGDCGFFRGWLEFKPCSDGFLSRIGPQPPPARRGRVTSYAGAMAGLRDAAAETAGPKAFPRCLPAAIPQRSAPRRARAAPAGGSARGHRACNSSLK